MLPELKYSFGLLEKNSNLAIGVHEISWCTQTVSSGTVQQQLQRVDSLSDLRDAREIYDCSGETHKTEKKTKETVLSGLAVNFSCPESSQKFV